MPRAPGGRRWSTLGSLAAVGLASWMVAALLVPRAQFSLLNGSPKDVGSLHAADLKSAGPWISASGTPAADALSFERVGRRGSFRLTHVKERPNVWLLLRVAGDPADATSTYVPPSQFSGRLVPLEEAGVLLRPIRQMIEERATHKSDAYVLVDGVSPRSYRPALIAAVLLALLGTACLSFAVHLCRAVGSHRPTS